MGAGANLRFIIFFFYLSPFLSGIFQRAKTRFARDFRALASGITYSAIPERKDELLVVHFFYHKISKEHNYSPPKWDASPSRG